MAADRIQPVKAKAKSALSYKEQKELDQLPDRIAALEAEQQAIVLRLADGAIYRETPDEARRLNERTAGIEEELMVMMERWEVLELRRSA